MKRLHTSTIIFIGIAVIFLIIISYILYLSLTSTKPHPGNCDEKKKQKNGLRWSEDCRYIQENKLVATISKPSESLYLSSFTVSPSLGPPLSTHVWYRYKYVNGKTGDYGQFSPWTKSPIIAGGDGLPCKDDDCSAIDNNCNNNRVELSLDSLDAKAQDDMYANIYRYVSNKADQPSDDTKQDELIGMLFPHGPKGGKFIDVDTPCKTKDSCGNSCRS